ncbi:9075_t:CDS:1, partial [Dentiscutata heterogama]
MDENSQKRNLEEANEDSFELEEENTTSSSNLLSLAKKKKTRKFAKIWDYYIQGVEKSHSHYEATCYYCISKQTWARGKSAKLEAHLANKCPNCLENIS